MVVRLGGETRRVRPGALGGWVVVFEGMRDVRGATVSTTIDGRPFKRRL